MSFSLSSGKTGMVFAYSFFLLNNSRLARRRFFLSSIDSFFYSFESFYDVSYDYEGYNDNVFGLLSG